MCAKRAYTILELLQTVALLAVLAAVVFPALKVARDKALLIRCGSNAVQLGRALAEYARDWDETGPTVRRDGVSWPHLLWPYVGDREVFYCPAAPTTMRNRGEAGWGTRDSSWSAGWEYRPISYALNSRVSGRLTKLTTPSDTVWAADGIWAEVDGGDAASIRQVCLTGDRHRGWLTVIYRDGHYQARRRDQLLGLRWTP